MREIDILIIGAGPAGLAAAIEIVRSGLSVAIIEQRETIGGAIYRQSVPGAVQVAQPPAVKARWHRLARDFAACGISVQYSGMFLGIDSDGVAMLENRKTGLVERITAKAVVIAIGAVEKVLPRPGWEMAGVSTAGGLQVMMKETGRAPEGRILLAGSGPLLLAVAAQMARLGNPPVAVIEAGDPLRHPLQPARLLAYPGLLFEAVFYLRDIWRLGVPWMRGTVVSAIEREPHGLVVTLRDNNGAEHRIAVDRIGLHDGIRPNDFGLPDQAEDRTPIVVIAGDCREALGAAAAEADGRRAARQIMHLLKAGDIATRASAIEKQRKAQAILAKTFAPVVPLRSALTDDTVICRCENRTLADLKTLCDAPDPLSGREVKHNGRFAMGACQGRFCAENTARLMAELRPDVRPPSASDLTGRRWPLRPISIGALVRASDNKIERE
ncbi:FAD-dependent oxidoreductase [Neorhizobium sp. LjRoot104]|uniref:FAD-dependent oxidoreductase n=1 Tax=Neorhizobium sp. LjRoot104 TaxID=3342254 RepID=UPI003ECF940C